MWPPGGCAPGPEAAGLTSTRAPTDPQGRSVLDPQSQPLFQGLGAATQGAALEARTGLTAREGAVVAAAILLPPRV